VKVTDAKEDRSRYVTSRCVLQAFSDNPQDVSDEQIVKVTDANEVQSVDCFGTGYFSKIIINIITIIMEIIQYCVVNLRTLKDTGNTCSMFIFCREVISYVDNE
jgi:hypothetical protein